MADLVAGLDAGFLLTETSTMPWHVLGILILDPSTAPEPLTVSSVRRLIAARLDDIEAFHKVVSPGPLGLWPRWSDGEVDLDWHVQAADLPADADVADLERYAARLAEQPLDRSRPLWEVHVAEHLPDGQVAVIAKMHHALADGVTAIGILAGLLDLEALPPGPATIDLPPPQPPTPPTLSDVPALVLKAGWSAGRAGVRAAERGLRAGRHSFGFMSARTSGHARLTHRRQVALGAMSVDDIKSAKAAYGVTFNDIVLAAITGAARGWLEADHQLPSHALLASVPVSIRSADGDEPLRSRNQVSAIFVSLPVQVDDVAERVRLIGDDTARSKALHEEAGVTTLGDLAAVAPWRMLSALWRAAWWTGAMGKLPPAANLIVSSVPGPTVPLYLAGARLVGLHPIGPLVEGVPLNFTAVSLEHEVDIGVLSCPDLFPDVTDLAQRLPHALDEIIARAPEVAR
ncbi:MAG TPA: wax ester/triacylglycerol synthase family O-acyltransferase [Acidimicrobiales bacterium]|nr:wax ester/triacylglycerol synthase family O-acyltransferase [Acidimicrobiales bacterium]